jgi:PAS domain S-box-containing protein
MGILSKKVEEAKKESTIEEKYQNLVEAGPDAIFVVSKESRKIVDVNAAACKLLGYSREEIIGTEAGARVVPMQKDAFNQEISKHWELGSFSGEFELVRKNGSTVPVEVRGSASQNLLIAFARDMSQRKQVEEEVHSSEIKFKTLAEQSPNMIFINQRGRVVYANKRCEEIMGYTREEFYSKDFDFMRLISSESRSLVHENLKKHMKGDEVPPYEYKLRTKDGREITGIHSTKLIEFEGTKAVLGIITDITKRKRAEEDREFLAKFPSENPSPVLRIGKNGKLIYSNSASRSLLKEWKTENGKPVPDRIQKLTEKVLDSDRIKQIEIELDGKTILFTVNPVKASNYVNLYGHDITERKLAEKTLRDNVKELEKWQRLTVGREVRMIELKNEIKLLKNRLKKYEK